MMETKENRSSQEVAAQSMKRMLGKIAGLIFGIILAVSSKGTILEILMCGIAMMGIASLCIEVYCFVSRFLGRRFYDEDGNCYLSPRPVAGIVAAILSVFLLAGIVLKLPNIVANIMAVVLLAVALFAFYKDFRTWKTASKR